MNDRLQLVHLLLIDEIRLVHDDRGAEFDLLDQQIFQIILSDRLPEQLPAVLELGQHPRAVHHRDDIVQLHEKAVLGIFLTDHRDGLGDRDRLTDSGSLDNNVIVLSGIGQIRQLLRQIILQRAADTAVGQWNQVFILPGGDAAAFLDQIRVDVDFADVIDDDGRPDAFLIRQNMIQQRGFACAQIACDQADADHFLLFSHFSSST